MQFYPAGLLKLVVPAVLIGGTLIGRAYIERLGSELRIILDYLPYLLCLIVVLMAYLFNRSRLMLAALGRGISPPPRPKAAERSIKGKNAWRMAAAVACMRFSGSGPGW